MHINLILPDLSNGDWTHGDVVFYINGDLKGYIQGTVEVFDKESETTYTAEFLFRVHDPENGNALRMVSFSETPKEIIKNRVDETWKLLSEQLTEFSLKANLKGLLTADIPQNYSAHYYDIKQDETRFYFYIDGSSGYALDKWTIPDAIAYHDTPEAEEERDIAVREAWGYYD